MPKMVWENVKNIFSNRKKGKKAVRNTIIVVVITALLGGSYFSYQVFSGKSTSASAQTAIVARGNISKNIAGSGTIKAIDQYEITALVKGEILSDHFQEGQMIKKGELMYTIDTTDLENNIKKAQASVEKSQLTYDQSANTLQSLTVKTGVSGVITNLYVKNGDNVSNGAKVADIVNTKYMKLKIKFNASDTGKLYVGQNATVNLESSFGSLDGEVTSIGSGSLINEDGVLVNNVELSVYNPGGIKPGDKATVIAGGVACNAPGTFEYFEQETVVTETSGKVTNLNFNEGDYIKKGTTLLKLDNDSTHNSVRQNALSLEDSKLALQNYYDQLDNYNITAPISGKVVQKKSKAGDKLDNSNSSTVMAIIADLSTLVFEISVDELDISNIKVGQEVEVTADAVEGKTFTGYVDNVSIVGTASNGVTSYPVKVVLNSENSEELIPGMNVNAKIVIESRENVLMVPISAINRGNLVVVKTTEANAKERIDNQSGEQSGNRPQVKSTQGQSSTDDEQQSRVQQVQEQTPTGDSQQRQFTRSQDQTPSSDGQQRQYTRSQGQAPSGDGQQRQNTGGQGQAPSGDGQQRRNTRSQGQTPSGDGQQRQSTRSQEQTPNSDNQQRQASAQSSGAPSASSTPAFGGQSSNLPTGLRNLKVPEGYQVVRVQIGLNDGNNVEIISGLNEGDVVLLPDKTTVTAAQQRPGGMVGGMPGGGMMGGMPGGNTAVYRTGTTTGGNRTGGNAARR